MEAPKPVVTAEQLLRMSSLGKRYELVRGGLVEMEPTGGRHGQVVAGIAGLLMEHTQPRRRGTVFAAGTGFRLERHPDTVLAPDVAYVAVERLRPQDISDAYPDLAPDIVVEVISPTDSCPAIEGKARSWIELGARIVWVVDPRARTVTIHETDCTPRVLIESDHLTADPVLPEFDCPVRLLFEA